MDSLKCYVCKKTQPKSEFQSFKSCQSCRKKKTLKKDSVPVESFAKLHIVESKNLIESTVSDLIPESLEQKGWCLLSGKWIRRGEEHRLHKLLLKKVNRQFLSRCAFPIHKYLTKCMMSDIRDV